MRNIFFLLVATILLSSCDAYQKRKEPIFVDIEVVQLKVAVDGRYSIMYRHTGSSIYKMEYGQQRTSLGFTTCDSTESSIVQIYDNGAPFFRICTDGVAVGLLCD